MTKAEKEMYNQSMTATGHAVIGTVIAATIGNPLLAVPIAISSHIFADLVPHWDAGTHINEKTRGELLFEGIVDVLLSILITLFLVFRFFPHLSLLYVFFIVFMAQLIDWLTAPYTMFNWKFVPFTWFFALSHATNIRLDKPWGIVTQASICIILVILAAGR